MGPLLPEWKGNIWISGGRGRWPHPSSQPVMNLRRGFAIVEEDQCQYVLTSLWLNLSDAAGLICVSGKGFHLVQGLWLARTLTPDAKPKQVHAFVGVSCFDAETKSALK